MYKEFVNIVFLSLVACVNEMYTFTTTLRVVKVYIKSGKYHAHQKYTFTTTFRTIQASLNTYKFVYFKYRIN